jgi:hypothetical protein
MEILDLESSFEEDEKLERNLEKSRYLAYTSGGIGLFIMLIFFLTIMFGSNDSADQVALGGFIYMMFASLVNSIVLILLIKLLFTNTKYRREIGNSIVILLANIPLALICGFLGIILLILFN